MMQAIEVIAKGIGYLFMFFGIWRLSWPLLMNARRFQIRRHRLRKNHRAEQERLKKAFKHPFFVHIRNMVFAVAPDTHEKHLWNFYGLTLSMFLTVTLSISLMTHRIDFALLMGLVIGAFPYIILRYRMTSIRLDGSLAFMKEFHLYLQAFQKNKDVYHSIFEMTEVVHDKRLRLNFQKLLSNMQKDRTEESFLEAIQLFAFSLRSTYASRYTNLLVKAYRNNSDISEGLFDIHRDLRKRERDMEALKTKRMETVILGFMPIVFIPIFMVMAYRVTMMYQGSTLMEQTSSLIGLIAATVLAVASALGSLIMSKPRADL
ncbi:hypothetical protein [Planomicrobium okeanokoites]|uniref:hypothetical protein n=1 Tax=Planomicrobium okeanokoites TaxID=244 RepID=UPI0024908377|nr:hypothetical protein [Planomicrobium okeanokoites]